MKRILALIALCSLGAALYAAVEEERKTKWIFVGSDLVEVFDTGAECKAQALQPGVHAVCEETGRRTPVDTTLDIYD